jgi:hypothetical protein
MLRLGTDPGHPCLHSATSALVGGVHEGLKIISRLHRAVHAGPGSHITNEVTHARCSVLSAMPVPPPTSQLLLIHLRQRQERAQHALITGALHSAHHHGGAVVVVRQRGQRGAHTVAHAPHVQRAQHDTVQAQAAQLNDVMQLDLQTHSRADHEVA